MQQILVALDASHKAHNADISQHIAKCDARRLFETVKDNSGAIEEAFVLEMLTKRSIPQQKLTFSCYQHIFGHSFTKVKSLHKNFLQPLEISSPQVYNHKSILLQALKLRNCGEFENALRTVVKCICNPPKYYGKVTYKQ